MAGPVLPDSPLRRPISGSQAAQEAQARIHTALDQGAGFCEEEHASVCGAGGLLGVPECATDVAIHGEEQREDSLGHEAASALEVVEALARVVAFFAVATLAVLAYPSDPPCVSALGLADHPAADGDLDDRLVSCATSLGDTHQDTLDHES